MIEEPADATTALLMGRIAVLEELVRWLSLTYGDNEPIFAGADGYGTRDGLPLGSAPQMHTLWHQVVGRVHTEGPTENSRWSQCPECGHWAPVRSQ